MLLLFTIGVQLLATDKKVWNTISYNVYCDPLAFLNSLYGWRNPNDIMRCQH